ncbi:MAG: hypothetical protein GY822_17950 [Deltaproteobacteria bacterium]|nr:hypothetical protein [Deltaproteobacteria bacterium]
MLKRESRSNALTDGSATKILKKTVLLREQRAKLRQKMAQGSVQQHRVASVLENHLRSIASYCELHDVELVVVALPVDVQVSPDE